MESLSLDPGVIAVLSIVGVGIILVVVAVLTCFVCNNYCRSGKSRCSIYYQPPPDRNLTTNRESTTTLVRTAYDMERDESNPDSVLVAEAPPAYHMATKYPVVYGGQYCIGLNGDSQIVPPNDAMPPDYNSITTLLHSSTAS